MEYNKIIEIVKKAGNFVFDNELRKSVLVKGEADFVTAVDLKISDFIKKELASLYPNIGFMSEEEKGDIKPCRWILDPIDGTTNLIYDYNMSSISLALFDGEKVVLGIVYNPFNKDLFIAERGKGVTLNGNKLGKAPDRDICNSLIEFGAGSTNKQSADITFELAKSIFKECLDIRRICSSALAISYVAAGKLNGYFEKRLKPWDFAAATLMLEECGCLCSDWDRKPLPFDKETSFVCGTPKVFDFLTKKIANNCI